MRSGSPPPSGLGTVPAHPFAPVLALALVFGAAPVMAMPLKWNRTVDPQPLKLHCVREGVVSDVQTRAEIELRNNIVDQTQKVADLIQEMDDAGFKVSGNPGAEMLTIDLPYRMVIDKNIDFRLRVLPTGLYVTRVASPGRARVTVNENAKRFLTPAKVAEMDGALQGWAKQAGSELEDVYREWGGGKLLRFTEAERDEMRVLRSGDVKRSTKFRFCKRPRSVLFIARWTKPLPKRCSW